MRFTRKQKLRCPFYLEPSQKQLEQHRHSMRRGLSAIVFATLSMFTVALFLPAVIYVNQRHIASLRSLAYDNFVITAVAPAVDPRGGGLFVFTNKGDNTIAFAQLDCHIVSMTTNNHPYNHLVFRVMKSGVLLHGGGDSQALPCPGEALWLKGSVIICADVSIEAKISLNDDPKGPMVKPFRYVKAPGREDWLPIAANTK